jgi:hypothetical protein
VQGDAGLHVDDGKAVADHVVDVTGDPQPLVVGAAARLLLTVASDPFPAEPHQGADRPG